MENKILKYDFLIVGSGLIGSLLAISLIKKKHKVLVIEKEKISNKYDDQRTLAINANSRDFLESIDMWRDLKKEQKDINQIIIKTHYQENESLIFENNNETMGSVIFNKDLLAKSHKYLLKKKSLLDKTLVGLEELNKQKIIKIKNKTYNFKKVIIATGKEIQKKVNPKYFFKGSSGHRAYVGFFYHSFNHNNKAYEYFTKNGPLAALPAPYKNNTYSTFIYSTKDEISFVELKNIIKKNFYKTHGKINLSKDFFSYKISPYLFNSINVFENLIFLGDCSRSIHPVAGQGWNLGIKDIQGLNKLIETEGLSSKNFNKLFYYQRKFESSIYFFFTEIINKTYNSNRPITKFFGKASLKVLKNFNFIREVFVQQAMGKNKIFD